MSSWRRGGTRVKPEREQAVYRTLILLMGVTALCGIARLSAVQHKPAPQASAESSNEVKQLRELNGKMDVMMQRLLRLEKRVARLEEGVVTSRFRIDENGVLRDAQGQPIGIWGVDLNVEESRAVPR